MFEMTQMESPATAALSRVSASSPAVAADANMHAATMSEAAKLRRVTPSMLRFVKM
jgi:hypothetical protein